MLRSSQLDSKPICIAEQIIHLDSVVIVGYDIPPRRAIADKVLEGLIGEIGSVDGFKEFSG